MGQCHQGVNTRSRTISQQTATTAKKRSKHSGPERRSGARYACGLEAVCLVGSSGKVLRTTARIVDISAGGIGLILKERFEEGTQIMVRLLTTAVTRPLPVKVVHLVEIAPHYYLLGGAFTTPFSANELHKLVS